MGRLICRCIVLCSCSFYMFLCEWPASLLFYVEEQQLLWPLHTRSNIFLLAWRHKVKLQKKWAWLDGYVCFFWNKRQKYAELRDLLGLELVALVLRKGRLSSTWNRSDDASWIHSRKPRWNDKKIWKVLVYSKQMHRFGTVRQRKWRGSWLT